MSLLDEIDHLYEQAVMEPAALSDQAYVDWSDAVAVSYELDRERAKYVRRCVNISRRLAEFWSSREGGGDDPEDWRSRVDLSLGVRAWRPQLDLAGKLLEATGERAAFDRVVALFRIVNNEPFLDGISYDDWRDMHQGGSPS